MIPRMTIAVITVLLAVSGAASSQSVVPPEAQAVGLTAAELPPGYVISESGEAVVGNFVTGHTVYGLHQMLLSGDLATGDQIYIRYVVVPQRDHVPEALEAFLLQPSLAWPLRNQEWKGPKIGDVTYGIHPLNTLFVQDRALVMIYHSPSNQNVESLTQELVATIRAKLESQGMYATPLELQHTLVSDTVGDGSVVRVNLTATEAVSYRFLIRNPEETVWTSTTELVESPFEFHWDGRTDSGTPAIPGTYTLHITGTTELGAMESTSFPIFVLEEPQGPLGLTASRDAFLRYCEPHLNEGANPTLALMKIEGKPARPVVGFELANLDTAAVARATLILTIDPAMPPTGWGGGRPIFVRRLLEPWTEGNGADFDVSRSMSGSGVGVTWFSPNDADIGNDDPDGPLQWAGGELAADLPTAPGFIINNHRTGEVWFDVTQDVRNGAEHGWLMVRDNNVGSKVRFYSREAGDADLAPRLVLEFGDTAQTRGGLLARATRLVATEPRHVELGGRRPGAAAALAEELLSMATRLLPVAELPTRLLYRLLTGTTSA